MQDPIRTCCHALLLSMSCSALALSDTGDAAGPPLARMDILSPDQWREVDAAIDRALEWLAGRQQSDGSFPSIEFGQPGVTGLCVLAFMSKGHLPGEGKFGPRLQRAIDYVLVSQQPSGLIARAGPATTRIPPPHMVEHTVAQTSVYNHAISGLMLTEAYAMTPGAHESQLRSAIQKALIVTLADQRRPKRRREDFGGWRYLDDYGQADSDLSVIGWQLMFLRSAQNAGFAIPNESINDAVNCIRRHFVRSVGNFVYAIGERPTPTRAMTGAGILALAHAGMHDTPEAIHAGQTMLQRPFDRYNQTIYDLERYHYSVFHCCQAAYQLGGRYWEGFFPRTARTLVRNQQPDGSWPVEKNAHGDNVYGNAYTTALVVLSLGAPNGILPIYQR